MELDPLSRIRRHFILFLNLLCLWFDPAKAAGASPPAPLSPPTLTPIHHLVILYDENVSFDHYFGAYPKALNPPGSPRFIAKPHTPKVDGFDSLPSNPNPRPFRLDRRQAVTADQSHAYTDEQEAFHHGHMDRFVESTGNGLAHTSGVLGSPATVMGYFDGNTVTALWNYAQHYALSDATFTDTFGPSTPGALEVVAGQTHGTIPVFTQRFPTLPTSILLPDGRGMFTLIGDADPEEDVCSRSPLKIRMAGPNIGELLDRKKIPWGNFMGGFDLHRVNPDGSSGCTRTSSTITGSVVRDYQPHHNGFQYYPSTANPFHTRPSSLSAIGHATLPDGVTPEPAHHQYDLEDFFSAVKAGNFPAVSFLKAPAFQDGHAGYSNPLDEQHFVVRVLNFLQSRPEWKETAVILTYDDSDGWYDHALSPILHSSHDPQADTLSSAGHCGSENRIPLGIDGHPVNGRCGPGPRIPLLVLSPWAKANWVDHTALTQTSILRFIEDNWLHGARLGQGSFDSEAGNLMHLFDFTRPTPLPPLFLDPDTGLPLALPPHDL